MENDEGGPETGNEYEDDNGHNYHDVTHEVYKCIIILCRYD